MRMELLEGKVANFSPAGSSTSTDGGEKPPAVILGGWSEEQQAAVTLAKATDVIRQLRVNLDMEEAFVPGIRRGYVIVPFRPRMGETPEATRMRVHEGIAKVRDANVQLGTKGDGAAHVLWMSISQTGKTA